ncbi:unnamed protein product, partial [Rotaria sordida]
MISSSSEIEWDCPECQTAITDRRKYCISCQSMLIWTCVPSGKSGLLEHTEEHVQIIADKGYIGEQYVITPRKKPRGGELTPEDKDFNRSISSARAAIENINQRIKSYAILG